MALTAPHSIKNRWDPARVADLAALGALVYRSNLLASDRSVINFGGGNTSVKVRQPDHMGRETVVMWVKGSGSDLATIDAGGFTGLRLEEILPLREREAMSDEEMVAYLARCQIDPAMPRPSIETLLHAFAPAPHVDHSHPDAIGALVGAIDGERLAQECFGGDAVWIEYIRPGFALSKLVADAVAENPAAKLVLLAKHGLVTWGATAAECYATTLDVINRAAAFVWDRSLDAPFGGPLRAPVDDERRSALLAEVLPALRGALAVDGPRVLQVDLSPAVLEFVCGRDARELSQVGAACPDHLVHTKRRPAWIAFDPEHDDAAVLRERLIEQVHAFHAREHEYFERYAGEGDTLLDPSPRVVLIEGVGLVSAGRTLKAARLSRDLYHRAIAVMRGAAALGGFVSLSDEESFAIEYWPLELYKLSLAPPPREFQGVVALITGGAGGIGSAAAHAFAAEGGCVVVADIDGEGAVKDAAAIGDAAVAFGGVDVVISNAGIASSAPITETTLQMWDHNHDILARGYFIVAREAARTLIDQGSGGAIVFIGSKNALAPSKGAAAYSAAKAAELHLARCLAEELGAHGIRVNTVNPDAVLEGSRIWDSAWREERARAYGIAPDELEDFYRERTTLKVNVLPADIVSAILFFCSPRRSGKSTGNILNVDGGVALAYPR
jgi:rhamnose utilization protein RhaD (predicted bifunctional aldolase and dehydrogenase)/NAD(P)-dependent dehydrogenase (short-subunit alcohol dehydrogenase family)